MPASADPVPVPAVALSDPSGPPTSIAVVLTWPDGSVTQLALSPPDPEVDGERWDARYSIDRDLTEPRLLEPATVRQTRLRIEVEAVYQPVDRHGQPRTYYWVSNRAAAELVEGFTSRFTRVLHRDRCVVGTEHEVQLLAERLAAAAYEAATGTPHPLAPLLEQIQRATEQAAGG